MHFKTIGAGALCGLTGLVAGCADATKRPETPAVMTVKQPNGAAPTVQAPGTAANPPALRAGQPVGGPASPVASGAQMQTPPNPNQAVVTSVPVPNPGAYGIAQTPTAAPSSIPYNTPLMPVTPVQYQGTPTPASPANMPRPLGTPPGQVSGMPPLMALPAAMPPATSLPPATLPTFAPAMTMAPPATNVSPTAVPSLPPLPSPTSVPAYPVPAGPALKPVAAVPAPALPPLASGGGTMLPDLDPAMPALPPAGMVPAPTSNAMPARTETPAAPGSPKPTNFTELPPLNLFPEPGTPKK